MALPRESRTSPQSTVCYAQWISPFSFGECSFFLSLSLSHAHTTLRATALHWFFLFTSQSKFIIGDKGLPFSLLLKKKKLYRSKIKQSPWCNESDPWGIWAPLEGGGGRYDPECWWKTGPPEKSLEGSDTDQWIKQRKTWRLVGIKALKNPRI